MRFVVLLPVHVDVDEKGLTAHPRRWVLLVNSVHRNLHLSEAHGHSGSLLDLRDYVTTCWLLRATPKSTTVSAEKKQTDLSYLSMVLEAMSPRARCIRVAVIDIVISAGKWDICVPERHKKPLLSSYLWQRTYNVEWL